MIMFVRDIGRSRAHDDSGDSLGIGDILASFHGRGTDCCLSGELKSLVTTGARWCAKSLHSQWVNPSEPELYASNES